MVRVEMVILTVFDGLPHILMRPVPGPTPTFVLPGGYWNGVASLDDTVEFELSSRYDIVPGVVGQVAARSGLSGRSDAFAVTIPFVVPIAPAKMKLAQARLPDYKLMIRQLFGDEPRQFLPQAPRFSGSQFHRDIVDDCLQYLRLRLHEPSFDLNFVDDEFTLAELWEVQKAFASVPMKKSAFRASAALRRDIVATERRTCGHRSRPAAYYRRTAH